MENKHLSESDKIYKRKNRRKKLLSISILLLWVVITGILLFNSPSLSKLVAKKGGIQLPDDYSLKISEELQNNLNFNSNDSYVAIFNSDYGLTKEDKKNIKDTIDRLKENKDSIYIKSIEDSFDNLKLKSQLESENNKTILALITVNPKGVEASTIKNAIDSKLKTPGVQTYLTGSKLIESDVNIAAQKGLNKTEGITIVFILVVLILLFKSVITPFIPLVTVGISYLCSQSVVAILVDKYNFPVSNYTQIFMICILFGIGTDYSILLLNRFKEEISKGGDRYESIKTTYKTAGKTVVFSSTPVLVVFASLNFVSFNLYRSAVAVAVGILFLVCGLFTIVPSFMALLGKNIFWPVKKKITVEENKLWGKMGNFAFNKPVPTLILIGVITIIPIVFNNWHESFNNLNEIGDEYEAKAGFNVVANNFGPGKIAPISMYIENDDDLRTPEYIALIEKISNDLENADSNIQYVTSVTRPIGTRIDDIYVKDQAKEVNSGINEASKGLSKVHSGLKDASSQINNSKGQLVTAEKGANKLQEGALKTKDGVEELQKALNELNNSINLENEGTDKLIKGVSNAKGKLEELKDGEEKLQQGYGEVGTQLNNVANKINEFITLAKNGIEIDTSELKKTFNSINTHLKDYVSTHKEVLKDEKFKKILKDMEELNGETNDIQGKISKELERKMESVLAEVNKLNSGMELLAKSMNELNEKSMEVSEGLSEFNEGLTAVENGLDKLNNGLSKSENGGREISGKVPEIQSALTQIANGQSKIKSGFKELQGKVNELSVGLTSGANGVEKIQKGIEYANGYINDWANLSYNTSGICVPIEVFNNSEFEEALNQYITSDGKLTVINVTVNANPYSNRAINEVPKLENVLENSVKGTKLENAHIGVGGIASTTYETKKMANYDYYKAIILVVIGVLIALILILKSFVMPIYLMSSLILTYFTSLSVIQFVVEKIMGYPGISWITSFFGFIVLMALGIDYSIFIMTRFNQYTGLEIKERMIKTMKIMGGVILSAVIILSGTFAALLPSGVLSLIEISMVVLTGIFLYVVIILPLFIPVMIRIFGKYNWWPFDMPKDKINNENPIISDNENDKKDK